MNFLNKISKSNLQLFSRHLSDQKIISSEIISKELRRQKYTRELDIIKRNQEEIFRKIEELKKIIKSSK